MIAKLNSTNGRILLNSTNGRIRLGTPGVTATPSIGSLSCTVVISTGDVFVTVPFTNIDATSALVEVSFFDNFPNNSNTQSANLAGGASSSFQFFGFSNPAGTQTFFARATGTGKTVSATFSRTDNMAICNAE